MENHQNDKITETYLKIALPVTDHHDPKYEEVLVAVNPTKVDRMVSDLRIKPYNEQGVVGLKILMDTATKTLYAWDAMLAAHQEMAVGLGVDFSHCIRGDASCCEGVWELTCESYFCGDTVEDASRIADLAIKDYGNATCRAHRLFCLPENLHMKLWSIVPQLESDFEPYGQRERDGEDCSCDYRHFQVLQSMPLDWGVCVNPSSPRCGLLTFEHQGCYHYEEGESPRIML